MSEPLLANRELMTCPLGSMVSIDPESLPLGTNPGFEFHYVDISCAANGRLQIPDTSITYTEAPSRARRIVKNGDVLMSTVRPNLKAFAYCNLPEGRYIASTGFAVLRAIEGNDPRYILYSILSDDVARQIDSYVVGSNYPAINSSDVKRLQVPGWRPLQQRRIAEILSTVDETIQQTEALIAKYQQIKAGLMHDLFTRGVTPDGHLRPTSAQAPHLYKESPLGWIPKEWGIVRVEDLCMDVVDCPHSTPTYMTSGVPCIRTADMQPGVLLLDQAYRVSEAEYRERVARLVPQEGDIIYSREGERLGIASPVGRERVCLGQRVMLMRPTCKTNPDFLLWSMNTPGFYRRILAGLGATTSPHINVGDIRKALLVQPSSAEQDLSGTLLARCSRLVRAEQAQLAKLRQVKHGLMQDLLTGRVRVKVGEAEETL
jgi:type I restriction enzyme S subunit